MNRGRERGRGGGENILNLNFQSDACLLAFPGGYADAFSA
jgi:hypothetical protein